MRRRQLLALAALAVLALAAGCAGKTVELQPLEAARPQSFTLDWVEPYPAENPALVFTTTAFAVTDRGWKASVAVTNRSGISWEIPSEADSTRRAFGVMVFETLELDEVTRRQNEGTMPTIRTATAIEPELPAFLDSGKTWTGRLVGRGPLPAGKVVRLSFGPFIAIQPPPKGVESTIGWITDSAVQLR